MSFSYNHCTLVGRLTRDPEIRKESHTIRAVFRLAVNRNYRQDSGVRDVDFIPIVVWGRLAEIAYRYLKKGMPVLVEGRINIRRLGDEDNPRWFTEINCSNFQLLGRLLEKSEMVSDDNILEEEDIPELLEQAPDL